LIFNIKYTRLEHPPCPPSKGDFPSRSSFLKNGINDFYNLTVTIFQKGVIPLSIILFFFTFSTHSQPKKHTFSEPKMGSPLNITIYSSDSAKASFLSKKSFQIADSLNLIFSDYLENSELNLLSKTAGTDTFKPVSPALWDIISQSVKASKKCQGAFDISVGNIVKLWRKVRKEKVLPDKNVLQNSLQTIGYQNIILDSNTRSVKLLQKNTLLDLGGIAKGYVAQKIVDFCQKEGIEKALVDAGGDLASMGSDWRVGVTIPNSEELIEGILTLNNQAVATSGNMYQFVEIEGKKYSHIVNPHTGLGLTHQRNVTVLAPDGATADWLATACSVLSVKKALKLIKKMPNCEVLMLEIRKGKLKKWQSKGFKIN
jgi:FAD:protein FMN transferase